MKTVQSLNIRLFLWSLSFLNLIRHFIFPPAAHVPTQVSRQMPGVKPYSNIPALDKKLILWSPFIGTTTQHTSAKVKSRHRLNVRTGGDLEEKQPSWWAIMLAGLCSSSLMWHHFSYMPITIFIIFVEIYKRLLRDLPKSDYLWKTARWRRLFLKLIQTADEEPNYSCH